MRPTLASILLLACLSACSSGSGSGAEGAARRVEIVAPGTGEPNAEPLFPVRVGWRWHGPAGASAVLRRSDRFGAPLFLQQSHGEADLFTRGHELSDMGRQELFWSATDDGLTLVAAGANEPLVAPILIVPAEVRLGMRWQVPGDADTPLGHGEVTGVATRETPFGTRRVWSLKLGVPGPLGVEEHAAELIEGRGPAGARWSLVPLDAPTETPDLPARVPLTHVASIAPAPGAITARGMSAVEDTPTPGRWQIGLGGFQPEVELGIFDSALYHDRRLCLGTDGTDLVPTWQGDQLPRDYTPGGCEDAAGRNWAADASYRRIPMEGDGSARTRYKWVPPCRPGQLDCEHVPAEFVRPATGVFLGADGVPYAIGTFHGEVGAYQVLAADDPRDDRPAWRKSQQALLEPFDIYFRAGLRLPFAEPEQLTRTIVLAPEDAHGLDVVFHQAHWVGAMRVHHRTPHVVASGEDERWILDTPRRAWPDLDAMTTLLRADDTRDLYQTSEDGLVWRVDHAPGVDGQGDGLLRSFVAALDLPAGHRLVGVVPDGDDLLAVTETGGAFIEAFGPEVFVLASAEQHLFRAALPAPGPGEPPPLWEGLDVARDGRDVRLCAPPGRALPTTGWTLGGEAARVLEAGPCLVLVRPHDPQGDAPLYPTGPAAWEVRGSLPGLGAVAIGVDPAAFEDVTFGDVRPLSGGRGLVDASQRAWPGLVARDTVYPTLELGALLLGGTIYAVQRDEACATAPCRGEVRATSWSGDDPVVWQVEHAPGEGGLGWLEDDTPVWVREDDGDPKDELAPGGVTSPAPAGVGPGDPRYDLDRRCEPLTVADRPPTIVWRCDEPVGTSTRTGLIGPLLPADQHHLGLDLIWSVEGTFLRRLDLRTMHVQRVAIPRAAEHGPLVARTAADGPDGATYLLLEEREGERPAWMIVRVDRVGAGLHRVTSGLADAPDQVHTIVVDADVLVLLDEAARPRWRGFRDAEPACVGASCACPFGAVDEAGACLDARADEPTVTRCADEGVVAGAWTRIDPDRVGAGDDGPEEAYWSRCDDGDWTEAPAIFAGASAYTYAAEGGDLACAPEPDDRMADNDGRQDLPYGEMFAAGPGVPVRSATMVPSLRGVFELELAGHDFELVLDDLDRFDPAMRRYLGAGAACGVGEPGASALRFAFSFGDDGVRVETPDGATLVPMQADALRRIGRLDDGRITLGVPTAAGYVPSWTSPIAYPQPLGVWAKGGLALARVRWLGGDAGCTPACGARACGGDGCGGVCGACGADASCEDGTCVCDEGLSGDGQTCVVSLGLDAAHPAASCAEALAIAGEGGVQTFWIDPDGAAGEPVYQAACDPQDGFTRPPNAFLGGAAAMAHDLDDGTCSAGGADAAGTTGGHALLYGDLVEAGVEVYTTHRALVGGFEIDVMLAGATGDQRLGVHLDALAAFDAGTLAWRGAAAACGASSSTRVSLWRSAGALRVQVGGDEPILVSTDAAVLEQRLRLETAITGNLRLVRLDSPGAGVLHDFGPLPGPVRLVASATAGPGDVRVQSARFLGTPKT